MKQIIILLLITGNIFAQNPGAGINDIEGNFYQTVLIGNQEWMAENLKVSLFSNGEIITNITDYVAWGISTTPAWCNYENSVMNDSIYGKLYNWYVVADSRNICPTGWHIPTRDEWDSLISYFGGQNNAGGALKESGLEHWNSPNIGANNLSNFTGLPGGYRSNGSGNFTSINNGGFWWSSTIENSFAGFSVYLYYNDEMAPIASANNKDGLSIRCVKPASNAHIIEINGSTKNLIKIVDILGKETEFKTNTILIYIFSDGSTEKIYSVE
jgi:uncharacterized protein (TIGR02145 family)